MRRRFGQTLRIGVAPGALALAVRGLNLDKQDPFGMNLRDVSVEVRAGEIVGIAGVSGNGQAELIQALAGLQKLIAQAAKVVALIEQDPTPTPVPTPDPVPTPIPDDADTGD